MSLLFGRRAGRYIIRDLIRRGSTSTVYLGEHVELGDAAAVKVLKPHLACHPSTAERFRTEARAAARLTHRSLVKVLDVGDLEDQVPYMVTELLQGRPLNRALEATLPITPEKAYSLVKQICGALEVVHDQGQVHRGVRPSKILVSEMEPVRLKLLGFSMADITASDLDRSTASTSADRERALFLSPEQAAGSHDEVSARTDIFAVGALIYWMLTGRAPETTAARSGPGGARPRELRSLRPDIADDLAELVSRCLQGRPRDRPRTVKEVAFIFGSSVKLTVEELESRVQDVISAVMNKGAGGGQARPPAERDAPTSDPPGGDDSWINGILQQQKDRSTKHKDQAPAEDVPRVDLPGPVDAAALEPAGAVELEGVVARAEQPVLRPVPANLVGGGTTMVPDDDAPTDKLPAAPDPGEPGTVLKTSVVPAEEIGVVVDPRPRTGVVPEDEILAQADRAEAVVAPTAKADTSLPDETDKDEVIKDPTILQPDAEVDARGERIRRYRLHVVEGPDAGIRQPLEVGTVLIGTHDNNDLVLTDPTVSRNHLEIQVRATGILVNDLDTSNGSFLGKQRLHREVIRGRARIRVGSDTVIELIPVDGTTARGEAEGI